MDILNNLLTNAIELIPTAVAVIAVVVVLLLARLILRQQYGKIPGKQFQIQLTMLVLSFFGLLVVILALPISDTKTGQILSLLGILLSAAIALSATTFVGNIMAGLMLRAVRNFRPGDFVRVADHFGRVSEQGLFHVEIQTEDRDLTTLPNLFLVTQPVKVTRSDGTFASAEVSLGYDVHHDDVQAALKAAATKIGLEDPFAHVIALGDFSVTYRVSGLLKDVRRLISTRSRLREAMLSSLHAAGIEIVSPTFMNQRVYPDRSRFVPRSTSRASTDDSEQTPEAVVFDKANEAESLERLQERHQQTCDEIKALKDQLDDVSDVEKERLKAQIEGLETRRDRLLEIIKGRKAE